MDDIRTVAVVGTGLIGASWASFFLARGLDVVAQDPAPGAEARLRAAVAAHWPVLTEIGLAEGASPDRLVFHGELDRAVGEADCVQETGPEHLGEKQVLFARLDAATEPGVPLVSSSSTLLMSEVQTACRHPERVVLGHPFNPPHLIPLVEVVGGRATSEATIARVMEFYRSLGKKPIRLKREIAGHVANRLQFALWQEAWHLAQQGVASIADIDAAIAHGPGLRWALLGPFLNTHLTGGPGGLEELYAKPLWDAVQAGWRDLGTVAFTPALGAAVAGEVKADLATRDPDELVRQRDAALVALLRLKAEKSALP